MSHQNLDPDEVLHVRELADRAEPLVHRRSMLVKTGGALVLPIVLSLSVTREAMGMAGSGGGPGGTVNSHLHDPAG